MWNTNDEAFDEKDVKVFNGGKAGEAICVASIVPKGSGDHAEAPDWKIIFTDKAGAITDRGFYTDEPEESPNNWKRKALEDDIVALKHMIRVTLGEEALNNLPANANTYKEFFNIYLNILKAGGFQGKEFVVFVTYGYAKTENDLSIKKNSFIKPRKYPSFIRNHADAPMLEKAGDVMTRYNPTPDAVSSNNTEAGAPVSNWN